MKKNSHSRPAAVKAAPQRTCVACRRLRPKRELVRLVRNTEGRVEIDATGRKDGRGAYLCPDSRCWEKALKGNQLEHTLKISLSREDRERIIRQAADLFKGAD